MSFFGSGAGTGFTGFGSPANQQQQQQQPQQMRFGAPANATQGGGFSFGQSTTPAAGTGMFGAVQPQQQLQPSTATTGFGFGVANNPTAAAIGTGSTGFAFNAPAKPPEPSPATGTGFAFGTPTSTSFGSGFGAAPNVTATPLGTQFGIPGSTASTGFSFGSNAPSTAVGFGAALPNATTAASPFGAGFGLKAPASAPITGLVTSPATPGNLSFGQPTIATPASATSFGFTGLTSTPAPSFGSGSTTLGFGIPSTSTPAAQSAVSVAPTMSAPAPTTTFGLGFNMGAPNTTFNLGGGATTVTPITAPQNKGFTFGAPTTSVGSTIPLATTQQNSGFQLGSAISVQPLAGTPSLTTVTATPAAATTALPALGLAKPAATTTSGTTLPSGFLGMTQPTSATTTPAPLAFNIGQPAASTTAPSTIGSAAPTGFGLPAIRGDWGSKVPTGSVVIIGAGATTTSAAPQTTLLTTTTAPATTALTTIQTPAATVAAAPAGTVTAAPAASLISFKKFEEDINKWTLELEDQERVFLSQATQVNAWDRILISNGDKITQLNDALERIKLDQEHLDQEIDFIRSQQTELEELLVPLEKSVESMPTISVHQHADLEREQTFQMAENIDSQLRLMSKDLKEIIEHLNSSSGNQDASDPIQQIGKILNSHMDSLQWIDQNTGVLRNKLDEVASVYENCRQDQQDTGMRLPYNL